jgi:Tfp pilus assembly protein PilE
MNNKGNTFLDVVVGIVILSVLFLILSNYTGFVFKTEKNLSSKLEEQVEINNLIEYLYSVENWSQLNNLSFDHSYTYNNVYDVEILNIEIKDKNYTLERSIERGSD